MPSKTRFRIPIIPMAGALYVFILAVVVAYEAYAYREFYAEMAPSLEAQLNAGYRQSLGIAGLLLALYLGIWSAVFGAWRGSLWQGLAAFTSGAVLTLIALSILPWIQFPFDQYPASFGWVYADFLPALVSWGLITILVWMFREKVQKLEAS